MPGAATAAYPASARPRISAGSTPVRSERRWISSRCASVSCTRDGGFFARGALARRPNVLRVVLAMGPLCITGASAAAREEAAAELEVGEQNHRDQQGKQEQEADHVYDGFEPWVHLPAGDQLDAEKDQPAAVERGHRQEVEHRQRHRDVREDGGEV